MSLPTRNLAPRRPAGRPPGVPAARAPRAAAAPLLDEALDVGDDTDPYVALPRHATASGTPVPAPPPSAPQIYRRPAQVAARVERRAPSSPWASSTSDGSRDGIATSAPRRARSPSNYELVAPGPTPRVHTPAPAPLPPPPAPLPPPPAPPPAVAAPAELPPDLAAPVYGLIRRLALQTELAAADRVLRVGIAELVDATVCVSRYLDADGQPWSLDDEGEAALGTQLLAQIAAAGRPLCDGRVLVQPIVAAGKTVALLLLTRSERLAGFGAVERAVAMLIARECAGLVHQLLGEHAQRARDAAADQKSLFRAEALESHRSKGTEGALINLSPAWVRRAYPLAIGIVVVALGFAYFAKVPTYSAGPVVVTVDGLDVTAPAPGTVEDIRVRANDRVAVGDELARLYSAKEQADLEAAETSYRDALLTFLVDNGDDGAKQKLAAAATQRQTARAVIETRTIRAAKAGVVSDVRVRPGQNLNPGDHLLTIVPEGADPVVVALLPGQDRPRLRNGMEMQVALRGFIKPRERVTITEVGAEVIGPNEARRALGAQFADSIKLTGPVVLVKARLHRRTFEAKNHTYHFHNGLHGDAEVRIEEKPFLVTLLPAVEKLLY